MAGDTRFQSKRLEYNRYELVQVNATINSYEVENKLKEVYAPVGVEWNVRTDEFNYKGDLSNFIDKPSGAFSAYNQKIKDLINAYKADKQVNSKACYVFILKENGVSAENKDSRDAQGIMPRGEQFGFVFTHKGTSILPAEELNQMVAHELGHGRWRLQHVFDGTYGFKDSDKGKTQNLMDYYSNGTDLAKWQWEQLNDPAWFTNPWESDEKGMWTSDGHFYTLLYVGLMLGLDDETTVELSKASEYPDTHVNSAKDMEESDTWARPKLQQRYHALTGGYHGIEVAATVYALIHTHKSKDDLYFLMHRFGDCFAHFDYNQDKGGFKDINLSEYIVAIDNYIEDKFNTNYELSNYISGVKYVTDLSSSKINTILSKEEVTKELINLILDGIDGSSLGGKLYLYTIRKELIDYLPKAPQTGYRMYGTRQLGCFTDGHSIHSFIGSKNPDAILDRKNAFLYYIRSLSNLLAILYPEQTGRIPSSELAKIIARFDKILTDAAYEKLDSNTRFDGIFQYEYLKTKHKDRKNFRVIIPVKYTENKLATKIADIQSTNFLEDSHDIVKSTKKYIESIEPQNKIKKIDVALIDENGIQYYCIQIELNYR